MASPPGPDLSPAGALLMVLTAFVGPELAPYVSAYSLILLGWCAGLMVGAYLRPPDGRRLPVAGFAFVSLVVVLGITVPASQGLSSYLAVALPGSAGPFDAKGLFLPVAAAIPAIGHRWMDIARWAGKVISKRFVGGA